MKMEDANTYKRMLERDFFNEHDTRQIESIRNILFELDRLRDHIQQTKEK